MTNEEIHSHIERLEWEEQNIEMEEMALRDRKVEINDEIYDLENQLEE